MMWRLNHVANHRDGKKYLTGQRMPGN